MLVPASLNDLMESSDVVGNIRFSHPTLYVFPGGQGDAALFGINGFNMLGKNAEKQTANCTVFRVVLRLFINWICFFNYCEFLVDGGFTRKSCFWDFTRHLDR